MTVLLPRASAIRASIIGTLVATWAMIGCRAPSDTGGPHLYEASRGDTTLLTPDSLTLSAAPNAFDDAAAQLDADALRARFPGSFVRWSSNAPLIATVNQSGVVVGLEPGSATVDAEVAGSHALSSINIVPSSDTAVRVIAHRGFMRHFPENTLVAVRGAFDNGADAVEVDIRLSRDGVPVVMHDATVDRTTNGTGAVAALDASVLTTLNACAHPFTGSWPSCPLPTMVEVLRAAHGRGRVLLHLYGTYTTDDLRKMLAAVHDAGMEQQTIFISFDLPTLQMIRNVDAVVPLGVLSTSFPSANVVALLGRSGAMVELQNALAHPDKTSAFHSQARDLRITECIWVAFDQSQARAALALGFRCIVADVPIDRSGLLP